MAATESTQSHNTGKDSVKAGSAAAPTLVPNQTKKAAIPTLPTPDRVTTDKPPTTPAWEEDSTSPAPQSPRSKTAPSAGRFNKMKAWYTSKLNPWIPLARASRLGAPNGPSSGPMSGLSEELEEELDLLLKKAGNGKRRGSAPKL